MTNCKTKVIITIVMRKASYRKEVIVDAAFALAREQGWEAVSARALAARIGSSTMPIYSTVRSMGHIEAEVRARAEELLGSYQLRRFTDNPALNLAIGYVDFARREPWLFRFLYIDRPRKLGARELGRQAEAIGRRFRRVQGLAELLKSVPELKSNPVTLKSWIFVHGLASMVASGALKLSEAKIRGLLIDAGGAFVTWEKTRRKGDRGG